MPNRSCTGALRGLSLLCFVAVSSMTYAGEPEKLRQVSQALEVALQAVFPAQAGPRWQLAVTPLVPAAWPPDGSVVAYGYARSFDPHVSDGEHNSRIWARVRVAPDGTLTVSRLAEQITELGIQGFRPVMKTEIDRIIAEGKRAQASFLDAHDIEAIDAEATRHYFQHWRDSQGLIAKEVAALHPAFFTWAGAMPRVAKAPAYGTALPNLGAPVDPRTLPLGIEHWIGPHTIYARGAGPRVIPWRVIVQLDSGVMNVGSGHAPGPFVDADLTEYTQKLDAQTLAELRKLAAPARSERPAAAEGEILIIGSDAGAYYLTGGPTIETPSARALIRRLRALTKR